MTDKQKKKGGRNKNRQTGNITYKLPLGTCIVVKEGFSIGGASVKLEIGNNTIWVEGRRERR